MTDKQIEIDYLRDTQKLHWRYAKQFRYDKRNGIGFQSHTNHRVMVKMAWKYRQYRKVLESQ